MEIFKHLKVSYHIKQVLDNKSFRSSTWLAYHLRTCQAKYKCKLVFFDFVDNLGNSLHHQQMLLNLVVFGINGPI